MLLLCTLSTIIQIYIFLTFVSDVESVPFSALDLTSASLASAFQSFMLGAGYPTNVPHYTRSFPMPTRLTSHGVINTAGKKVWREDGPTGGKCLWELHGVWGWDLNKKEGVVLRENYFVKDPNNGKKVSGQFHNILKGLD